MSNFAERGSGYSPETKSAQDFWDYERFKLSPEKIGEIENLYGEYQEKKESFENFGDQIRTVAKQIYTSQVEESGRHNPPIYLDVLREASLNSDGSISTKEKRLEQSRESGLSEWVPISPGEQTSIIKSDLEERRKIYQPLIDRVEEVNQQKRKEPDNSEFDFWKEYIQMREAMMESAKKVFALSKKYPSLIERLPTLDDPQFMEKIKDELLSEDLPANHPFKTIMSTEITDIGPISEDERKQAEDGIKLILADAKIDFSDADAVRDNEENRKKAFWKKLKTILSKDHLTPALVRSQLRLVAASYILEGGFKNIPGLDKLIDPNSNIETFLKNLEEHLQK